MSGKETKNTTVHCNQCGRNTEHRVLHEEDCSVTEEVDRHISVTAYEFNRLDAKPFPWSESRGTQKIGIPRQDLIIPRNTSLQKLIGQRPNG
jgi:hypothetical protein